MAKKKQQIPITPQMQADFNRYSQILSDTPIAPVGSNPLAQNTTPTQSYGKITMDDINKAISGMNTNEIPSLQQTPSIQSELSRMEKAKADTTTPRTEGEQKAIDTYYNGLKEAVNQQNKPVDYKSEIDRMKAMKADTNAQRTPGENQAIDTYLAGLIEAQKYVNSQNKVSQTVSQKKNVSQKKEATKKEEIFQKNQQKDYSLLNQSINSREQAMKQAYDKQNVRRSQMYRENKIKDAAKREQLRQGNIGKNISNRGLNTEEQAVEYAKYAQEVPDVVTEMPREKEDAFLTNTETNARYRRELAQRNKAQAQREEQAYIDKSEQDRLDAIEYNDRLAYAISQGFKPSQSGFEPGSVEMRNYINRRYADYQPDKNSQEYKKNTYYPYLQNKLENGEVLTPDEEADYARSMMSTLTPEEKRYIDWQQQRIYDWQYMNVLNMNGEQKELREKYLSNGNSPTNPETTNWANRLKALDPEKWTDEAIEEYRKAMYKIANQEATNDYVSRYNMSADDSNKILKGLDNTIESLNPARNVVAPVIGAIDNTFGGNTDVYAPSQSGQYASEYARGQVSNRLNEDVNGFAAGAYDVAMSAADTVERTALGKALGMDALTLMIGSSQAFNSTYRDARSRGLSNAQAKGEAALSAVIEWGTEKVPLERLGTVFAGASNAAKREIAMDILKQAGCEGSEEAISDVANKIADYFIAGRDGKDEYSIAVENYVAQGMPRSEAERQASVDFWKQTGVDFLGGAISGGILGGATESLGKKFGTNPESYAYQQFLNQKNASDVIPYLLGNTNKGNAIVDNNMQETAQPVNTQNNELSPLETTVQNAIPVEQPINETPVVEQPIISNSLNELANENNNRKTELETIIPKVQDMLNNAQTVEEKAFIQQDLNKLEEELQTINLTQREISNQSRLMAENAGLEQPTTATLTERLPENVNPNENIVTPEMVMENVPTNVNTQTDATRTITNTGRKTGFISQEELMNNPDIVAMSRHAVEHEEQSMQTALNRVSQDSIGWENRYLNNQAVIDNNEDVDTIMCLISDIKQQEKAAIENGDTALSNQLMARRTALFNKASADLTKSGQKIQALAKWTRTAEGAELAARKLKADEARKWRKKYTRKEGEINEFSTKLMNALKNFDNDGTIVKQKPIYTREQIVNQVRNTFETELSGISNQFDADQTINYFADLIQSNAPEWKLRSEIRSVLENGNVSGVKLSDTSPEVTNALNKLIKGETPKVEKTPRSIEDIKRQIRNTLDSENKYKEFSKDFSDEDIDFLANLINNGATSTEISDAIATKISTGSFGFSADTITKVNKIFDEAQQYDIDSRERYRKEIEAYKLLANEVGANASIKEKFDAWRYLAMLGNPKTHMRNILGNAMFQVVTGISNNLAAAMEIGVDYATRKSGGIERTKAFINPFGDLSKAAWNDAVEKNYRALSGNKYGEDIKRDINSQRTVFKLKNIQGAYELNGRLLDAEDFIAMRSKYSTSLAGYLKANGYDSSIFTAEDRLKSAMSDNSTLNTEEVNALKQDVEFLKKAREYAVKQAEYAAFHEDNIIADKISKFSSDLRKSDSTTAKVFGSAVEGVLPFKKTPANILRSGIEYSPLNIVQDVVLSYKGIKGLDNVKASDVIESLSKTLTGSGLILLGASLMSKGILNSSKDDEYYQDQKEGKQNYSITVPLPNGDRWTATIDSFAPSVMPLLVGAELQKIFEENGVADATLFKKLASLNLNDAANTAFNLADPIMETSMLSGLEDTLESVANATRYQNEGMQSALGTLGVNTLLGYGLQAMPTSMGQLARTIDPLRRSTYVEQEGVMGGVAKSIQKKLNAIPFVSMLQEPYINTSGETESNKIVDTGNAVIDFLGNFAYQALSPSYIDKIEQTDADKMARDVYANMSNPDSKVFEQYATSKKIDGKKISQEDYTTYMRYAQGKDNDVREYLSQDPDFAKLPADNQAAILKSLQNICDKIGEAQINPDFATTNKGYAAYVSGGIEGLGTYLVDKQNKDILTANTKSTIKIEGNVQDWQKEIYQSGNQRKIKRLSKAQEIAMELTGKDISKSDWKMYQNEDTFKKYLQNKVDLEKSGLKVNKDNLSMMQEGGISQVKEVEANKKKWTNAGMVKADKAQERYDKASDPEKGGISGLSEPQFAKTFKAIDNITSDNPKHKNDGDLTQDEMFAYFTANNIPQVEAQTIWSAYGDWKTIPVLENGKWKTKKQK